MITMTMGGDNYHDDYEDADDNYEDGCKEKTPGEPIS